MPFTMPTGLACTRGAGLPGQGPGGERLDHHRPELGQIAVGRQLRAVPGGAGGGHDRAGELDLADLHREVGLLFTRLSGRACVAGECREQRQWSASPSWYSCRLRTEVVPHPVGDAVGGGQTGLAGVSSGT